MEKEIVIRRSGEIFEAFFNATDDLVTGRTPKEALKNFKAKYVTTGKEKISIIEHVHETCEHCIDLTKQYQLSDFSICPHCKHLHLADEECGCQGAEND